VTPFTDYLARKLYSSLAKVSERVGSGNSGYLGIPKLSNCILRRSSVDVKGRKLVLRFFVGLPAKGRRILGKEAEKIVYEKIPKVVRSILETREEDIREQIELYEDQEFLRRWIRDNRIVSFIAEGSVLPRESSFSEKPLKTGKPFRFEKSVTVSLPSGRKVKGLAIPEGLTVITGGGYHGKTTILNSIQRGIYNHVKGDGRELVISRDCVLVFAENGRIVNSVDVSSFISNLPTGERTDRFSTLNASGSTSMAASIIEAIELGVEVILIDEDTSATNLLYKDEIMERLVRKDPIRQLCYQVRDIIEKTGTSFVIISGASSVFLPLADKIFLVENYEPREVETVCNDAERGVNNFKYPRRREFRGVDGLRKVKAKGYRISIDLERGKFELDLSSNPRIVEEGQVRLIARALKKFKAFRGDVKSVVESFNAALKEKGFEFFSNPVTPDLTEVDGKDFVWVLNRIPAKFI